jgi:hypothetical protein
MMSLLRSLVGFGDLKLQICRAYGAVHGQTTAQLDLPEMANGSLLIPTMKTNRTNVCNQDDAPGFIRLNALRLKVAAKGQRRSRR